MEPFENSNELYNRLAEALGITVDEVEEIGVEIDPNTGNSGDALYSYIISFKEDAPISILEKISRRDDNNEVWLESYELE